MQESILSLLQLSHVRGIPQLESAAELACGLPARARLLVLHLAPYSPVPMPALHPCSSLRGPICRIMPTKLATHRTYPSRYLPRPGLLQMCAKEAMTQLRGCRWRHTSSALQLSCLQSALWHHTNAQETEKRFASLRARGQGAHGRAQYQLRQ